MTSFCCSNKILVVLLRGLCSVFLTLDNEVFLDAFYSIIKIILSYSKSEQLYGCVVNNSSILIFYNISDNIFITVCVIVCIYKTFARNKIFRVFIKYQETLHAPKNITFSIFYVCLVPDKRIEE